MAADGSTLDGGWPEVVAAGISRVDAPTRLDEYRLAHHEIDLNAAGGAEVSLNGRPAVLAPGIAYAYRPGDVFRGRVLPGPTLVCRWVKFTLPPARPREEPPPLPRATALDPAAIAAFEAAFDALLDAHASTTPAARLRAAAHLAAIVALVVDRAAGAAPPIDRRLARALAHLERGFAAPLRLREVAAAAGWSEDHFTRRFRAALGLPPMQHLIRLRLRAVRRLLIEDDRIPLAEAARRCGFDDPDHCARLFRRHYGITPSAFRSRFSG